MLDPGEDEKGKQNTIHNSENSVTGWGETDVQTVLVLPYLKSNIETCVVQSREKCNMVCKGQGKSDELC